MKVCIFLGVIAATTFSFLPMNADNQDRLEYLDNVISRRSVEKPVIPFSHIEREALTETSADTEVSGNEIFGIRFHAPSFHTPSIGYRVAESAVKEKMDSVVRKTLEGTLVSKQELVYNEFGSPLMCLNSIPNPNGDWMNHSHYAYEYDDMNRVISRERVNEYDPTENVRYEYFYNDGTLYYTSQIVYTRVMNEWMPYQKAAYVYDDNHNTVEELYSSWSEEEGNWIEVLKTVASYDQHNRMTSYFQYVFDLTSNEWYGYAPDVNHEGQKFCYTEDGKDAMIANFI